MPKALPELKIIIDSREQKPWKFDEEEKKPGEVRIIGSEIQGLNAGDYTAIGLEKICVIERKAGFRELFGNMSPKENKDRFEREMERMVDIPHKYLLIETNLSHDILSLSVPQYSMGPPCSRVLDWLIKIELEYKISVKFVGECGQRYAKNIFKNIARKYLYG